MVFFFKQKTAYEMRISDWSSDVCSSDLNAPARHVIARRVAEALRRAPDRLVDPIAPLTLVLARRVGVLKIARPSARAGGDGFEHSDRKSGEEGTSVSVRLDRGGRRVINKHITKLTTDQHDEEPTK